MDLAEAVETQSRSSPARHREASEHCETASRPRGRRLHRCRALPPRLRRGARTLSEARQELRAWAGETRSPSLAPIVRARTFDADRTAIRQAFARATNAANHPYLNSRGLRPGRPWRARARRHVASRRARRALVPALRRGESGGPLGVREEERDLLWLLGGRTEDRLGQQRAAPRRKARDHRVRH
jgi:hypothetical protein